MEKQAKSSDDNAFAESSKLKQYEESQTVDSGFISGGNLQISGEILTSSSSIQPDEEEEQQQVKVVVEEDNHMRLDSGVDLSESFSDLHLKNSDLNDLSSSKKKKCVNNTPVASKQLQQEQELWQEGYQQDEDGNTYLHIAIVQGWVEVVVALIRAAPHPQLLDTPNDSALTPLHLAALTKQWRLVRWLIVAGAKPGPRNINGDSPLHIAARNGDVFSCKAITDPVQEQERNNLALSYVQQAYAPVNLDQWNYEGQTCIHVAALGGHIEVLRHLVWYGADINAREGTTGYTALHYAIQRGDDRLAKFLLKECSKLDVGVATYGGRSVLQLGFPISTQIAMVLQSKGAPPALYNNNSDDEDDEDDDESSSGDDEMMYETKSTMFTRNLVDASA